MVEGKKKLASYTLYLSLFGVQKRGGVQSDFELLYWLSRERGLEEELTGPLPTLSSLCAWPVGNPGINTEADNSIETFDGATI